MLLAAVEMRTQDRTRHRICGHRSHALRHERCDTASVAIYHDRNHQISEAVLFLLFNILEENARGI